MENLTNGVENAEVTVFNVIPEGELETSVRYDNKHFEDLANEERSALTFHSTIRSTRFNCHG